MDARCSAKQVAEAVIIRSANNFARLVLCVELEDAEYLKCLDLLISALDVFKDAFSDIMETSFVKHEEVSFLSKQNFIEYLKPRALILTEENGYFDFMLTCAYASVLVNTRAFSHNCFHFAKVACKLLTSILEERFEEIFETDSGWENLMSYCKNIHAAVYPSKSNRPPGYEPYSKEGSDYDEGMDEEIHEPFRLEVASDSRIDDSTYWKYFKLESKTIRERITDSKNNLEKVTALLIRLGMDMDSTWVFPDKHKIPISDDEYIEQLEKENERSPFFSKPEISISQLVKDCFAKEICEKENEGLEGNSSRNQIRPEDVTRDEVMMHLLNMCDEELDEEDGQQTMKKTTCVSPDKPVSDDEYIEQLEKENERSPFYSKPEISISHLVKDCFGKEVYEKENEGLEGNSSRNQIRPEDITRDEVMMHLSNMRYEELDEEDGQQTMKKTTWVSPDKHKIPVSDDENIEQLEKENKGSSFYSKPEISISHLVKDCFAKEICENENEGLEGNSSRNQIRPEDINLDDVMMHLSNMCNEEFDDEDDPKCELCDGKMQSFITNWKESFRKEYLNSDIVTEII